MANLKYQLKRKMESLKKFGQSKHAAKKKLQEFSCQKKMNSLKVLGIYSKNTYKSYMDRTQKFGAWMQKYHNEVKKLSQIKKCQAEEYLVDLMDKGLRAATLQTYAAAICKVMDWNCTDINKNLPRKCSQTPQKGRNGTSKHFSMKKHNDLIDFIKNTGLRASEVRQITPKQIKIAKNDVKKLKLKKGDLYLDFYSKREYQKMTKNGKGRFVTRIKSAYGCLLKKMKFTAETNCQNTLWDKYGDSVFHNGNLHQYRREYAQNLYNCLIDEEKEKNGFDVIKDYHSRKYDEWYNRYALAEVSKQLGHSRLDVVINNYFR